MLWHPPGNTQYARPQLPRALHARTGKLGKPGHSRPELGGRHHGKGVREPHLTRRNLLEVRIDGDAGAISLSTEGVARTGIELGSR